MFEKSHNHVITNSVIVLLVFTMIVSVPLSWLMLYVLLFCQKSLINRRPVRLFFYLYTIIIWGYINNAYPVNSTDVLYYKWLFDFSGLHAFSDFLKLIPKDPLFHIFTYLVHQLTCGNFKCYLLITTLLAYIPIIAAFELMWKNTKLSSFWLFQTTCTLLFFFEYFSYTAHILRQVLAGALSVLLLVYFLKTGGWRRFILLPITGLIHSSSFIFISALFLPIKSKHRKLKVAINFILISLILYGLMFLESSNMLGEGSLSYAVSRYSSENSEVSSISSLALIISFSPILFIPWIRKKYDARVILDFCYSLIPILMVMLFSYSSNKLLVLRFMLFIYMYLPIICSLVLAKITYGRLLIRVLTLFLLFRFFYKGFASDLDGLLTLFNTGLINLIYYFIS